MAWGIWWILTKTPKIWNFMGSLRPKCTKNQSKNDRRITCHHTEQWSKIWIFTWELESLKVCTLMELLYPPLITYWLKTIEKLCVITLNRHTKFEEEPTYCCKKDMRSLVNFNLSTQKSQNLKFHGLLTSKVCKEALEKLQKSYVSSHWTVMQNLRKGLLVPAKMIWGIWQIFMKSLKRLKIDSLVSSLCPMCI